MTKECSVNEFVAHVPLFGLLNISSSTKGLLTIDLITCSRYINAYLVFASISFCWIIEIVFLSHLTTLQVSQGYLSFRILLKQ